jgi:ATP-dependent Clp protease protease subunit
VKNDIVTYCIGQAASMGALLMTAGTKGKRFSLPNSRIMIHQPSGGARGQATEIEIAYKEIQRMKDMLNEILAKHSGQKLAKVAKDVDRDYFMSAAEALDYGRIVKVLTERPA